MTNYGEEGRVKNGKAEEKGKVRKERKEGEEGRVRKGKEGR